MHWHFSKLYIRNKKKYKDLESKLKSKLKLSFGKAKIAKKGGDKILVELVKQKVESSMAGETNFKNINKKIEKRTMEVKSKKLEENIAEL